MPKTKMSLRRPRGQQNSGRCLTRPSTHASSGTTTVPAPRGTGTNTQPQPDQLAEGTLTNLLDLIRDQVRVEIQAQQAGQAATTPQAGQPTATETAGQQATTGQAAVTTSQAHSTGAGMLVWGNWGELGWAPHWRVEHGCGRDLCVCMYVTVWLRVMPGVYSRWWEGEGRVVKGLTNLCTCTLQRALLAVHVHSVTLRGG